MHALALLGWGGTGVAAGTVIPCPPLLVAMAQKGSTPHLSWSPYNQSSFPSLLYLLDSRPTNPNFTIRFVGFVVNTQLITQSSNSPEPLIKTVLGALRSK